MLRYLLAYVHVGGDIITVDIIIIIKIIITINFIVIILINMFGFDNWI